MDLQKASVTKRAAAWLLDAILVCVLALGFAVLLSAVLRYDSHYAELNARAEKYEQQYGPVVTASVEVYEQMSAQQKESYGDVAYLSQLVFNLTLVIVTLSVLFGVMITEYVLPLFLKHGQTVGKKAFGIGLMRVDGVRISNLQLFVRALLGKYTIETMIPVYMLLMLYFQMIGITGIVVLLGLLVAQLICVCVTRNNSAIHDLMAATVAVDLASQKVFNSTEDLLEYTKKLHAEKAKKQDY